MGSGEVAKRAKMSNFLKHDISSCMRDMFTISQNRDICFSVNGDLIFKI